MATQFVGTNPAVLFPADACPDPKFDEGWDQPSASDDEDGNAFRGLFFAMLFNLFLLLTGAAGWELWRIMR